ncbi:MAG: hypothetical protein J6A37_14335 [Oscillospiraceae bacterium]|nr:hypothetical protein [Oscillospiraceae bacterium]
MNITSVSNSQLYSIVTGNEFAWIHSDVTKAKEYSKEDLLEMSQDYIDSTSIGTLVKSGVSNMDNWNISDNDLAEYIGNMGKRIDTAYSNGILSEEDYAQLCEELDKYIDEAAYSVEYKRCAQIISRNNTFGKIGIYSENMFEDMRHQILDMMNTAENKMQPWQINRSTLLTMIDGIRYLNK